MEDEKTCSNCKFTSMDDWEEPCCKCRNTSGFGSEEYHKRPFLWQPMAETVNHPSHYNQGKFECIEVMLETFGKEATKNFCLLNVFKYIWRAGDKNGREDIKKAVWYLDKFLELESETDE